MGRVVRNITRLLRKHSVWHVLACRNLGIMHTMCCMCSARQGGYPASRDSRPCSPASLVYAGVFVALAHSTAPNKPCNLLHTCVACLLKTNSYRTL
jgi:hypothetical protein